MKKAMLFLMISASCHYGCTDHGPLTNEPEMNIPTVGYSPIDSVLAYNRHVPLDLDSDGSPDLYFTSMLVIEDNKSCLYLHARAVGGTGTRVLVAKNPQLVSNGRWAYPLPEGAVIGDKADVNVTWIGPGQNAALLRIVENREAPAFSGPWLGKTDHYVGFRKVTKGHEQFGWVRISHKEKEQSLTVQDMGVSLVSGAEAVAGKRNP